MSTEIIKSITFDEKRKRITVRAASSNVTPRIYDLWSPTDNGNYDYEEWKDMLASSLFGGTCRFLPSCKSKAHKAFKMVNRSFGMRHDDCPFHCAWNKYPYDLDPEKGHVAYGYVDAELKEKYEQFRDEWIRAYRAVLDEQIGALPKQPEQLALEVM